MTLKKVLKPGDVVCRNPRKDAIGGGDKHNTVRFYRNRRKNNGEGNVGTVLDLVTKKNSRGASIKYANVLWGGRTTPSLHAVNRLDLKVDSE